MEFLAEHNVVNRDEIKSYVERFASNCTNETAKEWFRVVVARYLEKSDDLNVPWDADTRWTGSNRPAWLDGAIDRGDDLRIFRPSEQLPGILDHLVDYLNWLDTIPDGKKLLEKPQQFLKLSFPVAIDKAHNWVANLAKHASTEEVAGAEVVMRDGAYVWINATNSDVLFRDGKLIQNCLGNGTYHDLVAAGNAVVYLLRDHKSLPHVAIRANKTSDGYNLQEVKGKQNYPPVGRYVNLTKNFLNYLKLPPGGAAGDINSMGLKYDNETKSYGTQRDSMLASGVGKIVWRQGDIEVLDNPTDSSYWFLRGESTIARLTVTGGKIAASNLEGTDEYQKTTLRTIVKSFLNEHFDRAPPPNTTSVGGGYTTIMMKNLQLWYNWENGKYGRPSEDGVEVLKTSDVTVTSWANDQHSLSYRIDLGDIVDDDFIIDTIKRGGKTYLKDRFSWQKDVVSKHLPTFIEVLNALHIEDLDGNLSSIKSTLVYNAANDTTGLIEDVAERIWTKGKVSAYLYKKNMDSHPEINAFPVITFVENDERIFNVSSNNGSTYYISYENEPNAATKNIWGKYLAAGLNAAGDKEDFIEDYDFSKLGVFQGKNDKWGTRSDVATTLHKFDNGTYIGEIDLSESTKEYILFLPTKAPVFSFTFSGNQPKKAENIGEIKRRSLMGPYFKWLFNELEVPPVDVPNNFYRVDGNDFGASIFSLGLFYDAKNSSWKLLQDGKIYYEGSDFKAITFRNRTIISDNVDGILGWFKKEGDNITDIQTMPGVDDRELYQKISEITHKTDFHFTAEEEETIRRKGFHRNYETPPAGWRTGNAKTISHLNDTFAPDPNFLKLPAGWVWAKLAYDPEFSGLDHGKQTRRDSATGKTSEHFPRAHGELFTLRDKAGKSWARVSFSDDGYLEYIKFHYLKDETRKNYETHRNEKTGKKTFEVSDDIEYLKAYNPVMIKLLCELLDKTGYSLTPQQASDLKVYRKNGEYISMASDKGLMAFANGEIDFKDGHVFEREKYGEKEWNLYDKTTEGDNKKIATVKLSDAGLETIHFHDPRVKRRPKLYTPYVHKLLDIFARTAGDEDE
jgi:hypothetical protein